MPSKLIISGSSNSGKSHVVNMLRKTTGEKGILIPHRFITRPPREGKKQSLENTNLTLDDFQKKIETGEIGPYWTRFMEIMENGTQRTELYGFENEQPLLKNTKNDVKLLLIYSANNDCVRRFFDEKGEGNVHEYFENAKILHIDCPEADREERMLQRADNLIGTDKTKLEAKYRLADNGDDVRKRADFVLDNSIENSGNIESEINEIISKILKPQKH